MTDAKSTPANQAQIEALVARILRLEIELKEQQEALKTIIRGLIPRKTSFPPMVDAIPYGMREGPYRMV